MKHGKLKTLAVAALIAAVALPSPSVALRDDDKAKLVGALVGIAIAKKVAQNRQEKKARGEPYQPAKSVMCLPEVRKCYWNNRFSSRWTHHEFD